MRKKAESDIIKETTVIDAIRRGQVSTKVNREKQARHIKAGKDYIEGRSYMYGTFDDVQAFIDRYAGTGKAVFDKYGRRWLNKERIHADTPVGRYIDPITGSGKETGNTMIVYSKTGTHAYPRKDDD